MHANDLSKLQELEHALDAVRSICKELSSTSNTLLADAVLHDVLPKIADAHARARRLYVALRDAPANSISPDLRASLTLNAEQWQLYKSMPIAEDVASAMSSHLISLVAQASQKGIAREDARSDVRASMHAIMLHYKRFGAYDTEPCAVLERLLDVAFGPSA